MAAANVNTRPLIDARTASQIIDIILRQRGHFAHVVGDVEGDAERRRLAGRMPALPGLNVILLVVAMLGVS
jgi:hypothetical protein